MTEVKPAIRPIGPDELLAASSLRHSMVLELDGSDLDQTSPGWRERYRAFFGERLKVGQALVLVAEKDGTFVGLAGAYLPATQRTEVALRPFAYICNVYVSPEFRRQGLARALTQQTIEWAKACGCDVVRLRASHMGRPVYESMGFKPSDELELGLATET
jgi:ribosomal protein S18 acetylase RimI-like enzyme